MKISFKDWCYFITYGKKSKDEITKVNIEGLIRCMWRINRERKYVIQNNEDAYRLYKDGELLEVYMFAKIPEQAALQAALEDVYKEIK